MEGRDLEIQPVSIGTAEISTSKGNLCDKCLAISWKPDDFGHRRVWEDAYEWTLDHHETFSDLEASCEAGCQLCQTFFLLLTYDGRGSVESDPLHWTLEYQPHVWSLYFANHRNAWNMYDVGRGFLPNAVTTVKGFTPSGLTDDLHALLEESMKPWLEACLCPGVHTNCPSLPPNEEESYRMPTRLIDVGSEKQPTAKIVVSADLSEDDKRSPYLILSYQWGKGNGPARTTTRNLEERKDKIMFQDMPKTIRDAMDITRLMGIRYLWVDAVCIIQADRSLGPQHQDDVAKADWEKEAMNMAAYYTNALCCIAAASAKDSSEGFLTERQVAKYGYREWHSPVNTFFPSPYATRRRFRSSLLSRGWCLQEWLLSPRVLHWTSNGLIWQCPQGFFWEGQSGYQGETPEAFSDMPFNYYNRHTNDCILYLGFNDEDTEDICQILQRDERDVVGETWTSLVTRFLQMNLSFSTDRLAAIQGIATRLSERHGLEYFAGVFRSHCVKYLLWRAEVQRTSLERVNTFPTWSWASSPGEVYFFPSFGAETSLISDLQPFPSAEEQRNFLNPANKELRFVAPLAKLSDLEPEEVGSEGKEGLTESEETSKIWPGRSQYVFRPGSYVWGGLKCDVQIDNLAISLPLTDRAYLLVLRYTYGEFQGLVMQKVKNEQRVDPRDKMNVYERIGIFYTWGEMTDVADTLAWKTKVIII